MQLPGIHVGRPQTIAAKTGRTGILRTRAPVNDPRPSILERAAGINARDTSEVATRGYLDAPNHAEPHAGIERAIAG